MLTGRITVLLLLPLRMIALSTATLSAICLLVDRSIRIATPIDSAESIGVAILMDLSTNRQIAESVAVLKAIILSGSSKSTVIRPVSIQPEAKPKTDLNPPKHTCLARLWLSPPQLRAPITREISGLSISWSLWRGQCVLKDKIPKAIASPGFAARMRMKFL